MGCQTYVAENQCGKGAGNILLCNFTRSAVSLREFLSLTDCTDITDIAFAMLLRNEVSRKENRENGEKNAKTSDSDFFYFLHSLCAKTNNRAAIASFYLINWTFIQKKRYT
jgi:hypothetical protein